jgi:hypothetical protein
VVGGPINEVLWNSVIWTAAGMPLYQYTMLPTFSGSGSYLSPLYYLTLLLGFWLDERVPGPSVTESTGRSGQRRNERSCSGAPHLAHGAANHLDVIDDLPHAIDGSDDGLGHLLEVIGRQAAAQAQHPIPALAGDISQRQIRAVAQGSLGQFGGINPPSHR